MFFDLLFHFVFMGAFWRLDWLGLRLRLPFAIVLRLIYLIKHIWLSIVIILLWVKVNNYFVLLSAVCCEESFDFFFGHLNLIINTGWASAMRGASQPALFASAVIIVAVVFTVAALLEELLSSNVSVLRVKGVLINLFGFCYNKLSYVIVLVIIKTPRASTLWIAFPIGLETCAVKSQTVGALALAANDRRADKSRWNVVL